jgi:predicted metal-dependent phosphoesterase TrpH
MKKYITAILLLAAIGATAQLRNADVYKMPEMMESDVRRSIRIPNINGFITIKCDLHSHTVFSDGKVWPDVRVTEAWQQGLDAIAMTDHLEHRPRKDILKGDHNEAFRIAQRKGAELDLLVIQGAEITRSKPFGHINALFITDANPLAIPDSSVAVDIAIKQGGIIQWNHPGWPDNKSTFYPVHEQMIKDGKIHAVEVFNYNEYYPIAFDWCKKLNLAFTGNSDIHELITEIYGSNNIRPMTLVFASERSLDAIRKAILDRRTAALFNGILAGRENELRALFKASVQVKTINAEKNIADVTNSSDITYTISFDNQTVTFPAGQTVRVTLPKAATAKVLNCFTGHDENLTVQFPL